MGISLSSCYRGLPCSTFAPAMTPTLTPNLQDLRESVSRLLDQQDQLLKKIAGLEKPPGKDRWDKLSALSGLAIAIVGGLFSYLYSAQQSHQTQVSDNHQAKIEEVQTVGTFMPYLVGNDQAAKNIALSEVENLLNAQTAVLMAEHINSAKMAAGSPTPDPAVLRFLQHMADNGKTSAVKELANAALTRIRTGEPPAKR